MLIKDPVLAADDADDVNLKRRYSKYNFQFQFLLTERLYSPTLTSSTTSTSQ